MMNIYERIEVMDLNKIFSITAKADVILPIDCPDAALINESITKSRKNTL
jgi:hypothetical protein